MYVYDMPEGLKDIIMKEVIENCGDGNEEYIDDAYLSKWNDVKDCIGMSTWFIEKDIDSYLKMRRGNTVFKLYYNSHWDRNDLYVEYKGANIGFLRDIDSIEMLMEIIDE